MNHLTGRVVRGAVCSVAAAGLAVTLTACGTTTTSGTPAAPRPSTSRPAARPGVAGTVAAVAGDTMQVQNNQGQTAVTFGAGTRFSDTTAATRADVTAGECVAVTTAKGTATSVSIVDSCAARARPQRQRTTGTVTALTANGFTLANGTAVTVGAATRYTKIAPTTSAALAVGQCVVVTGPADSTGAVTATSVSLRPAGPDGCTRPRTGRG